MPAALRSLAAHPTPQLNTFTTISGLGGNGACMFGIYGSYEKRSVWPAFAGIAFTFLFNFARDRVRDADRAPPYQGLIVLTMLITSFALHIVYLPAGLCCFVALLLCQNELLMPKGTRDAAARRAREAAKAPAQKE